MAVLKNLSPIEARRCAAESESICWVLIAVIIALTGFGVFLFVTSLG
jgi:hypothetical protein